MVIRHFRALTPFLYQFDPATGPWPSFLTAAIGSLGIYVGVFLRAFWWSPRSELPHEFVDMALFMTPGYIGLANWILMVSALFLLWAIMLRAATTLPAGKGTLIAILLASGICYGALLATFPVTNSDIFHYIADARLIWVHSANPLVVAPDAFLFPDLTENVWWWRASPYGPLWQLIGLGSLGLGLNHAGLSLLAFKGIAVLFWLATSVLVYLTALQQSPRRAPLGMMFLALNPLAIILVSIGGQNDTSMMFFAALGFFLMIRHRWLLAPAALVCAVLIKFSAGIFLPIAFLYIWRKAGPRQTFIGFGIAAAVAVIMYAPFFNGSDTFAIIGWQTRQLTSSPATVLSIYFEELWGHQSAQSAARFVSFALFALIAGPIALRWWRGRADTFTSAVAYIVLAYLMIAVTWWQPWYLLWLLVPVAMTQGRGLMAATATFCWAGMMSYIPTFGRYLWWQDATPEVEATIQKIQTLVVFLPPFTVLAAIFAVWLLRQRAIVRNPIGPVPGQPQEL